MPTAKKTETNPETLTEMVDDDGWEEVSDDTGDLIAWGIGEKHRGIYLKIAYVTVPATEENPEETVPLYVFENRNGRWSTWPTFQLEKAMEKVPFGNETMIECTGQRKAKVGNMLVFSVKHRAPRPTDPSLF
jgi:hypothetical protein